MTVFVEGSRGLGHNLGHNSLTRCRVTVIPARRVVTPQRLRWFTLVGVADSTLRSLSSVANALPVATSPNNRQARLDARFVIDLEIAQHRDRSFDSAPNDALRDLPRRRW